MNKRFVGVLTFAFLVAAGASLVLYRVLINRPTTTKAAPALAQVALATKDLEVGTVLKEDDVKVAEWPGAIPVGATTQVKDIIGRGVITAIFAKEPIIESRLAPKGAGGGMAAMIPPGMRAVAVRVNEVVGVAGFVVPGMHVDVLISGNTPGRQRSPGHADPDPAAEYRSALRRSGFQEGRGRQADHGAGGQHAGDADAGRATQPGRQPDQHPTGAAQSAGPRDRQDSRDRAAAPLHDAKAPSPQPEVSSRPRAARSAPRRLRRRCASRRPPRPRRSPS